MKNPLFKLFNGGPGSGCHGPNCGRPVGGGGGRHIVKEPPVVGGNYTITKPSVFGGETSQTWKIRGVSGSEENGWKLDLEKPIPGKAPATTTVHVHGEKAIGKLADEFVKANPSNSKDVVVKELRQMHGNQREHLQRTLKAQSDQKKLEAYRQQRREAAEKAFVLAHPEERTRLESELSKAEKGFDSTYQHSDDPIAYQRGREQETRILALKQRIAMHQKHNPRK